jgi:5-methylcytosine-specific restriction enzyme subunit McrC
MKHVDTINLSGIAFQSPTWVTGLIVRINEGAKVAKPLTLFEHETIPLEWSDRDLRAIERPRATTGQEILRSIISRGRRGLQATSYVGVTRLGRRNVQILPKIFRSHLDRDEQVRQATGNLLHMLEVAGQIGVREHGLASLLRRDVDRFEVLTRLFATHLREQWERGPFRTYRAHDDELPVLRGTWRVADRLRHPHRKHVLAVTYDEFSTDNPLNRLLRFVTEQLWRLTADAGRAPSVLGH